MLGVKLVGRRPNVGLCKISIQEVQCHIIIRQVNLEDRTFTKVVLRSQYVNDTCPNCIAERTPIIGTHRA